MSDPSPCILCGSTSSKPGISKVLDYLTYEHFDIVQCTNCGFRVTHPMPGHDAIDKYYPPRYRGNRHSFTGRMRVVLRRRAIEALFPWGFRGRLLDIGCGNGAFILEMKRRGWDVCATEIDGATLERLRAAGIEAKFPDAAEKEGFSAPFDAITCWHVMEHVEHPQNVARWVVSQLKPEGIFQTTVPNAASLQARLFGKQWLHLDVPRHRYHFSPATFRRLLKQSGLTPLVENCFALEYDWFAVIQSALNVVCFEPNGLFEALTLPSTVAKKRTIKTVFDAIVSYTMCVPLAIVSLPPILIAAAAGDGATTTISCHRAVR